MNTNSDNTSLDDPRFDRLVDGELSEPERRELLAGLDSDPGGWRRCALAFLESQCWTQSLKCSPHTPCADIGPARGVCGRHSRVSPWSGHLGTLLAMAACFLAVFWGGSAVLQMRRERPVAPAGAPSEIARNTGTNGLSKYVAQSPSAVRNRPGQPGAAVPQSPWRMVTVAAPGGSASGGAALRLPAVERNNIDPEWLRSLPSAVPDDVMQALNRTGHQIEQQRELVPVPLQDGRQLVVPVDNVKVHYVGNETY